MERQQTATTASSRLALGSFRPVYLWGGTGTRRMNRLKFMGADVDDKTHDLAHSELGVERIAAMGFNWVYLSCNWGFPPETEEVDWEMFRRAVRLYHAQGIQVAGYVQTSNCVFEGSYQDKDWYSLDPQGRKVHYYTGRYMTCLLHEGWQAEVRKHIRFILEADADAVFFDNPWFGGPGEERYGVVVGNLGCYHPLTRAAYRSATGEEIPFPLDTRHQASRRYLRWRAETLTAVLAGWAADARAIRPDVLVSANNFDNFNRNGFVEVGIDFPGMAQVQDLMLLENFALPRRRESGAVISNAVVIGAAQSQSGGTAITTVPYEKGIGFDRVWAARTYTLSLLESMAMNAPLMVKGTEYLHRKTFTMLLHSRYRVQHEALGRINRWLESHADWLAQRTNASPLAIFYPYEATLFNWEKTVPYFYGACETIFQAGLPFRVVGLAEAWDDITTLIVPPGDIPQLAERLADFAARGGRIIPLAVPRSSAEMPPLWRGYHRRRWRVPQFSLLQRLVRGMTSRSWAAYHNRRSVRWLVDRLRIPQRFLEPRVYEMPPEALQGDLVSAIGPQLLPRVEAEQPLLLTIGREQDGRMQYHLVNYDYLPQRVTLHLRNLVSAEVYTPGNEGLPAEIVGSSLVMQLETAKIVRSHVAKV